MNVRLLDKKNIIKTSKGDPVKWHYYPVFRRVFVKRLELALRQMKPKYERILEIGYGSGIFFPELSKKSSQLFGLDIHDKNKVVEKNLLIEGIKAKLFQGSAENMPFKNSFFDCIVSISALDYVENIENALNEITRVAKPNADIIVGIPFKSFLSKVFLLLVDHSKIERPHSSNYLIKLFSSRFKLNNIIKYPSVLPFYCVISCSKEELW